MAKERATEQLRLRLTPTQKATILDLATEAGMDMTEYPIELVNQAAMRAAVSRSINRKPDANLVSDLDFMIYATNVIRDTLEELGMPQVGDEIVTRLLGKQYPDKILAMMTRRENGVTKASPVLSPVRVTSLTD